MRNVRIGLLLIIGMVITAGCGQEQEVTQPEVQEPEKIYVYAADDEFEKLLTYAEEDYPELQERLVYVKAEADDFGSFMNNVFQDEEAEEYPDIIVSPYSEMGTFVESENIAALSDIGITDADCSQMYGYSLDAAKSADGSLKGLTWRVNPGVFMYRTELAEEIFGDSSSKNIQSYTKDWDTFTDTARSIYKTTDGKTAMLASGHEVEDVFACSRAKAWLVNDEINIDKAYDKLMDVRYTLEKNGLVKKAEYNGTGYLKAAGGNSVFGYFVTADFLSGGGSMNINGMKESLGYTGDWNVCAGPAPFAEMGSYIMVTDSCCDKELVAQVIKKLCCDMAVMEKIRAEEGAFVNNAKVMANAYNTGKGQPALLGGNDYIKVCSEQATSLSGICVGKYDTELNRLMCGLADEYVSGSSDKDAVKEKFVQEAQQIINPPQVTDSVETSADSEQNIEE